MWDPASQTYIGGNVPSHHSAIGIEELLESNDGKLKIFGYGSLCWHPGSDGVLSLANIEEDERDHDGTAGANVASVAVAPSSEGSPAAEPRRKVTTAPGRAIGYQRCWSQRSADHRGSPQFNGIVCTLLSDQEVWRLQHDICDENGGAQMEEDATSLQQPSMTEGLIYTVDQDLVDDCLAELDFREKGGYARDVINVVEDDTGNTVKALLYRGTPDNPAFWKRVLVDLPLAAAIVSKAVGPSGPNDMYLLHLHSFLVHAAQHSPSPALALKDHSGDVNTGKLAKMVKLFQSEYQPYFIFGAGSNEHGQLLLKSRSLVAGGVDVGDDDRVLGARRLEGLNEAHELTEMLLIVPRNNKNAGENRIADPLLTVEDANSRPMSLHAGGGHSALLTRGGDLYLWGWNDSGQLGRPSSSESVLTNAITPFNVVQPLADIKVAAVDLGHSHTLVIEKDSGRLFGFGENGRGQSCDAKDSDNGYVPQTPRGLSTEFCIDVAAGLFHSAAITKEGELITWGCGRFGQCLRPAGAYTKYHGHSSAVSTMAGRWRPPDGSKLVQVVCGRRHTVVLDERGRVWAMGDNKYGQLGCSLDDATGVSNNAKPRLVEGLLGLDNSGCFAISSGWSHIVALVRDEHSGEVRLYGWGRNDKGQLGIKSLSGHISKPEMLKPLSGPRNRKSPGMGDTVHSCAISIQSACCGAESSHVLDIDGNMYSTGWDEHGNLAIGHDADVSSKSECSLSWMLASGARVVAPLPAAGSKVGRRLFAAGGAHVITMAT